MSLNFSYCDFNKQYIDELIVMWRNSFEKAVGIKDPHSLQQQKNYFLQEVLPENKVLLVLDENTVVGFIAAKNNFISQLYVHLNYQKLGIGSKLLDWAKTNSVGYLELYTFASNKQAQKFYESNGFIIIARGFEETWKLPDIKYRWQREQD